MGGIYSTPYALREYADWGIAVNKYAYDASLAGDKMQSYPLRVPQEWAYRKYPIPSPRVPLYQQYPVEVSPDWIMRNGVRTRYTGLVAPAGLEITNVGSIVLGFIAGWAASKYL